MAGAAIGWSGGSACVVAFKNGEDMAIVLAADTLVHKVTLEINEVTGKAKDKYQVYKTDDNPVPVHKVCIIHDKFGCASVGLRKGDDGVDRWVKHLIENTDCTSTMEKCIEVLEAYRQDRFHNHGDKKTVEIVLVGWNTNNEPIIHYFTNNGSTPITGAVHSMGKGRPAQLMALTNKQVTTLSLEAVVAAVERAIFDAHISSPKQTGLGVDVLIIRPNKKPDPQEIQYQTIIDLKTKFGTDKTTYNERLQKRKEEEEAISQRRGVASSSRR